MLAVYVDISSNNGTPNLVQYRDAGYTDLMLKATEGTGYAWNGMPALAREWHSFGPQFRVGYYHWLYGTLPGLTQYMWFWAHVGPVFRRNPEMDDQGRELGDWMMTDFEDVDPSRWVSDAEHLNVLRDFDTNCLQHGWIDDYAPDWYLSNLPQCVEWLKDNNRPVVASDYSHTPPGNRYGLGQVIHQFTDRASVPGMATLVDENRYLPVSGDSTLSNGATPIGDDSMSAADVAELKSYIYTELVQAVKAESAATQRIVTNGLNDIKTAILLDIRDSFLAAAGQKGALPDGTRITDLTSVWHLINDGQKKIEADLAELAASPTPGGGSSLTTAQITAAAETGAAQAINATKLVTTTGGN